MSTSQSPLSTVLLLFCLPLLGALVAGLLSLSFPVGLLPVALTAGLGAWLGTRFRHPTPTDSGRISARQPAESLSNAQFAGVAESSAPSTAPTASARPAAEASAGSAPVTASQPPSGPAVRPQTSLPTPDPKLRHDIRNILSPAMLAAEQLGTSTDPLVLKAVKTIDESLDRALLRLKQKPQS
ncbi:hypothetical protein NKW54_07920 [Acetobacter cerevisiae]|uniref:Uncharacterized protein n=1 Tax=Acetobacter cerevisiae TaxID=178900 RepID=A0A149UYH8_9PROT|nr:hypothetical protein [Acetobacter cerevisiae]KXV72813.1 hypothetical protein AD952_01460 [Acetobacter cerevisiae]MCP1245866.1 hypothetical protein [Acetobacter cerevisiae]MCP1255440.1 hypothetical protein [Acetobacter cerevisiae]